jgi:hypothetical protein
LSDAAAVAGVERRPRSWALPPWASTLTIAALALGAAIIAGITHASLAAAHSAARATLASLVLFAVTGDAVAVALVPRSWGAAGRLAALPLGAAVSGLALTVLGFTTLPLRISLWLVLATGAAASLLVRRRRKARAASPSVSSASERWSLAAWVAALALIVLIGLAPAWRTGITTIYGQNPDSHQVAGIAVLFQHVPPTGTDDALPIDTVPGPWRFRYPIFYTLAGASNLGHQDPIVVFPAMAALLLACLALGFGAFAVLCLGAPPLAGPAIAAATAVSVATLHIVWHPYWNQLWGLAMLPWALLFGWRAVVDQSRRAGVLFALVLLELGLAYPLALPYPLLIIGLLAIAHGTYRLVPQLLRSRSWVVGAVALVILAPAVAGAAIKLGQGVAQLVSGSSSLWSGDISTPVSLGNFVGTGGGVLSAFAVLAVAAVTLLSLPRRSAVALGASLAVLCLLDLRFRLASRGAYMDFKHLSFVGALVLTLAATGVARLLARWRAAPLAAGGALAVALGWGAVAVNQARVEATDATPQVNAAMFQVRQWASKLPPGASVRVDIPASGYQLWAVYMLGDHPVDAPDPVLNTTYAHAPYGLRADYSLSLRYEFVPPPQPPPLFPQPHFTVNPPVFENGEFVLRKVRWPRRLDWVPQTASTALVEP